MEDVTKQTSSRWVWWLIAGAALLAITTSAAIWFIGPKVWTDGASVRIADRDTKVREVIWAAPEPLEGFASDEQVYEPSISPDGTELYFVHGKAGGNAKIYLSRRHNNAWTKPVAVDSINGPFDSLGPRVSPDGNLLYFYSNRPGGLGGYDIWAAPRTSTGWGKPFNLGPQVNSEFNEFNPDPTPDGRRLIFATNRKAAKREQNEAWRSTIRETVSSDYDLWIAQTEFSAPATTQPAQLAFRPAHEIPGINTEFTEGASCMSPTGDFLYFASNRPGGQGKFDIWRSRVRDGVFTRPENIAKPINSSENEADPALAYNGFRMIFSSDRPGADGRYHLLVSDSREVYTEHQARPMPTLGWSWWLLIISLLVLVPLLLMMRGWEDNRFSLIQKCLLLSLLVHALITFILSFVAVTQQVTQYVRREMQLDVAVNLGDSRGVDETLAIRGQVSGDLPVSAPPPPSLEATKVATPVLQASSPIAMDAPISRVTPGGMAIPVEVPRIGVPAPHEPTAQVTPSAAATPAIEVAIPKSQQMVQAEAAPSVGAAKLSVARMASSGTTDAPVTAAPSHLQLPAGTVTSNKASDLPVASAQFHPASASSGDSIPTPAAKTGVSSEAPQVAVNGIVPPAGRASAAEPALVAATTIGPPTTRPIQESQLASANGAPKTISLAVQPSIAFPGDSSSTAAPQLSRDLKVKNVVIAAAIQPKVEAASEAVDPPEPNLTVGGKIGEKITGGGTEGPVVTAALPSPKLGAISNSTGSAPSHLEVASAKISPASATAASLASAGPTHVFPTSPVDGGVPIPTPPASQISAPQVVGPKIADALKAAGSSAPEKTVASGAAPGTSARLHARDPSVQTHSIDITPAPVLASGKVPSGGHGGPGLGGVPTARPEIASAQVQPQVSLSALSGPLGPGKSLVPDLTVIRAPEQRQPMLEQFGGTKESEDAVARGLAYLAHVQEEDGRWTRIDSNAPRRRRGRSRGQHDMACTGLALLAFLGHDETPDKPGQYKDVVSKAVNYLVSQQDEDGDLRGPQQLRGGGSDSANMYDQGIATYALAECSIMTRDPKVIDAAIKGAKFIVAAQDPQSGGWRYSPQEYGDSSVFGWQIMALHSAQQVGFEIPQDTIDNAKRYIRSTGEGRSRVLAGYQPHTGPTAAMTSEVLFARMLLDMPLDEEGIDEATRFLAREPPEVQRADLYYWYYASLSMLHMQNPLWKDWNVLTRESLIRMQLDDGGWEVNIKWGERGGRVFTTALATLTLEVYYRYLPLRKAPVDADTTRINADHK